MIKKSILKISALLLAGVLSLQSAAVAAEADYNIIPAPLKTTPLNDANKFVIKNGVSVVYPKGNADMKRNAEFLAQYVKEQTGITLNVKPGKPAKGVIALTLGLKNESTEAYKLTVAKGGATICGASAAGVFYGVQTLRKAISATTDAEVILSAVEIEDAPRFNYRGQMLDVARHFFSVDEIKTHIDELALHNINRFHWHLTEDQGWRIEIKALPLLTEKASKRKQTLVGNYGVDNKYDGQEYGGFYTQEEVKDIIKYAADRYITIIPEIDLPGHMQAALYAYPNLGCTGGPYEVRETWGISDDVLCAGNEDTFKFIETVLGEIIDLFPSEYIHVGGDECPKVRWKECPKCQAKIKELGLKSDGKHSAEEMLQSYVISRAEKFVNSRGRKIIGWSEILEGGIAPNATLMSWLGETAAIVAAKEGHDAILVPTSYFYFDYCQSLDRKSEPISIGGYVPVEKVYSYNPQIKGLTPEELKHIIGIQANIWTEYMKTFSHVQYMLMPRVAALCEVQWSTQDKKNYADFLNRMSHLVKIYDKYGWNYATHIFDVATKVTPDTQAQAVKVEYNSMGNSPIYYTLDGSEPTTSSALYTQPLLVKSTETVKAVTTHNGKLTRVSTKHFDFNKATMKPIKMIGKYDERYTPLGAVVLVDGCAGTTTFDSGAWVGVQRGDIEAEIDLQDLTEFSEVGVRTLISTGSWIFDARGLEVSVSADGKNFTTVAKAEYPAMVEDAPAEIVTHKVVFTPVKARYVRVKVASERSMPQWHGAKGSPAYVFADEFMVK